MSEPIEVALQWAVWRAKRRTPKVGNDKLPTPWDVEHREIDALLDRLEAERATAEPEPTPA